MAIFDQPIKKKKKIGPQTTSFFCFFGGSATKKQGKVLNQYGKWRKNKN